jgi:vWA-MoxR associated protein C-terminal domain/vWA-MoxR associated protein middle region 0
VPQRAPMRHQTIVVVDVAGFTRPDRTPIHQIAVREGLRTVLESAFAEAGIDLDTCTQKDSGDGKMILVPPEVDNRRLVDQLPSRLVAWLRKHNAVYAAAAAIQLRVALHAGEVYQDGDDAVGPAVNLTFRILEAPAAKLALRASTGALALIASDDFYHNVIVNDPAVAPGSYRQVPVPLGERSTVAWLCLPDGANESRVLDLLPAGELQRLREWLVEITIPELRTLVQQAAGLGVPLAGSIAHAGEGFSYLAEFNARADGFPPALMFVELLAHQVGGAVSAQLREWNDAQARHLRLLPQLQKLRERLAVGALRVPVDSRLHLLIVVDPDGIDPNRYLLSSWRQDDPAQWSPARGETRMVTFEELERRVDDLVVSAERAWSGHAAEVALEFVLPRKLLNLPVHLWRKEHDSEDPRLLSRDYPIVVRSLERMRSSHWHRVWRRRWQTLMDDPSAARVHFGQPTDPGERHRLDDLLHDPQWVLMVLTAPPPCQPQPGADELTVALRSGLPALVWHPGASAEDLREIVSWLVADGGLGDLPRRAQDSRHPVFPESAAPFDVNIARDVVVLWDNPLRLVIFDQPADQPPPRGDIADEREQAS